MPKIVIVENPPPDGRNPSVAPHHSIRSVGPLASSLYPSRSIFPSVDAAKNLPARHRRTFAGIVVAGAVLAMSVGIAKVHQGPPAVTTIAAGNAALRTTPSGASEFWPAAPAFVLDPSLAHMTPNADAAIIEAFSTWDTASVGVPKATFSITSTPGKAVQDGVSRIVYAPITVSGYENALALTIGYADPSTGALSETDVIFNSKYTFQVFSGKDVAASAGTATALTTESSNDDSSTCNGNYDVQDVATHETGHVYGLGEDMQDTTTTMYVHSAPCETHKRVLSPSDEKVMTALYKQQASAGTTTTGAGSTSGAGCGATVAAKGPGSQSSLWAGAAVAALLLLRRRRLARTGS